MSDTTSHCDQLDRACTLLLRDAKGTLEKQHSLHATNCILRARDALQSAVANGSKLPRGTTVAHDLVGACRHYLVRIAAQLLVEPDSIKMKAGLYKDDHKEGVLCFDKPWGSWANVANSCVQLIHTVYLLSDKILHTQDVPPVSGASSSLSAWLRALLRHTDNNVCEARSDEHAYLVDAVDRLSAVADSPHGCIAVSSSDLLQQLAAAYIHLREQAWAPADYLARCAARIVASASETFQDVDDVEQEGTHAHKAMTDPNVQVCHECVGIAVGCAVQMRHACSAHVIGDGHSLILVGMMLLRSVVQMHAFQASSMCCCCALHATSCLLLPVTHWLAC